MSDHVLPVGLGELRVSRDPRDILVCYGLGSCVGICLYDPAARVGGMAHVVLPDSGSGRGTDLPARFADTAVPRLVQAALAQGAVRSRLVTRIAGGAQVLKVGATARLDIGARNCEAVREGLRRLRIALVAADVGGHHGRTVQLFVADGRVLVSTVGRGEHEL